MIWIIFIGIIIIIFFFIIANSGKANKSVKEKSENSFEAEIDVPNPENSNPKSVIEFIDRFDSNVIKPTYDQLISLKKNIPPLLDAAFKEKIQNHYLTKEIYLWNMSIENRKIIEEDLELFPNTYIFELKGLHQSKYTDKLKSNIIYDEVWLVLEPENEFDKDAIKVENLEGVIGYVPKNETNEVATILKKENISFLNKVERQTNYLYAEIIIYYK